MLSPSGCQYIQVVDLLPAHMPPADEAVDDDALPHPADRAAA